MFLFLFLLLLCFLERNVFCCLFNLLTSSSRSAFSATISSSRKMYVMVREIVDVSMIVIEYSV